ncbi:2-dehydropantoate 2-reductase N-terminal domain-containing protein [Erwiniaceae bacterium L1_54_3]|nr:2-dehydropantoate 2-reductase N-terminal domain-containing protein [Erwiniaceae bacterium L1_54_3]
MDNKILIWGAGAIGGTVGAYLARAGLSVTFVDIDADHVSQIRDPQRGLRITGLEDFNVVAPAFLPDELQGRWKRIFLAVKSHHTAQATALLQPFLAEDGYVLSLQNGLCESTIAQVVGADRTLGAFVNFYADWMAPGEIHFSNRGAAVIGELDGSMTTRLDKLCRDLRHFEPDVIQTKNLNSWLWGKLAYGSLLFAQATGQMGIADCLARQDIRPVLTQLAAEIVQLAEVLRIPLKGFNGFEPSAFLQAASGKERDNTFAAMVAFNRPNSKTHSGIWRDLAVRKRVTEVDGQLGIVTRMAAEQGMACLTVEALITMIHQIETGQRLQADHNLNELLP